MNRKEALALKEDRDYWKKLCKELSDKNLELQKEVEFWKDLAESCECNN